VKYTFKAHEGMISSVSIAPNGKYLATGGKDKKVYVWDIIELNNRSREFDAGA
jgi:guanine nucleotide-binding protein subunit beta-2-like 1 protein